MDDERADTPRAHLRSRSTTALHSMLSDPTLHASLRDMHQFAEEESTSARAKFVRAVKRYYYQLAIGCGNIHCNNKLCRSNLGTSVCDMLCNVFGAVQFWLKFCHLQLSASQNLSTDAAAILAVQLATRPTPLFCPRCPEDQDISLPPSLSPYKTSSSQDGKDETRTSTGATNKNNPAISSASLTTDKSTSSASPMPKPFLYSLLSASPFTSLFASQPTDKRVGLTSDQSLRRHLLATSLIRNQSMDDLSGSSERQRTVSAPQQQQKRQASASSLIVSKERQFAINGHSPLSLTTTSSSPPLTTSMTERSFGLRTKSLLDLPTLLSHSQSFPHQLTRSISQQVLPQTISFDPLSSYNSIAAVQTSEEEYIDVNFMLDIHTNDQHDDLCDSGLVLRHLTLPLLQQAIAALNEDDGVKTFNSTNFGLGTSNEIHDRTDYTQMQSSQSPNSNRITQVPGVDENDNDDEAVDIDHQPLLRETIHDSSVLHSRGSTAGWAHSRSNSSYAIVTSQAFQFINKSIQAVFSDSNALNDSFKCTKEIDGKISQHPSGLDFPVIEQAYQLILSIEPRSHIRITLCNAIELLLAQIVLNHGSINSRSALPQFMILLENPLLHDAKYQESLLKPLTNILAQLKPRLKATMIQWFSCWSGDKMGTLVQSLQRYITEHYYPSPKMDDAVVSAVRVLGLLYSANETAQPAIVSYNKFYNGELCRKLNFKDEYRQWRKTLEKQNVVDFSFLNYPFLFDVVDKSRILHIDAMVQMSLEYEEACIHQALVLHTQRLLQDNSRPIPLDQSLRRATNPYLVLEVRREQLIADVLNQLQSKVRDLKKPLKVKFVGGGEEGMDQGGVQKEFFQVLVSKLMDPVYGMFVYDEHTRYNWINGHSLERERQFELVGIALGLAMYNGVILDVKFPRVMYKKLVDETANLEDVKDAFPGLGRGLEQMLTWTDGDVYDVFMRNFEISLDVYGQVQNVPLMENGENVPVTNENRQEYVRLYVNYIINIAIERQFEAFKRGFHKVCGGHALRMCRPEELELLLCGQECDLDFHELEESAAYDDGYSSTHVTIRYGNTLSMMFVQVFKQFWDVVHSMTYEQKKHLLNFVTASDRVPVKGLGHITFVIQRNGPNSDRLPTALTCFGRLLLPEYQGQAKLRNRLLTAIENAKGFGLV